MRQQLVKNLLFILLVNILVKTAWIFFIDRNVQIKVGNEQYGAFQALFNLSIIFQILLDFGLTQYNSKEVAADAHKIQTLFSSMFWTRLFLIAVYVIIVMIVAFLVGYTIDILPLLLGVLSIQALSSMLLFLRSNVAALHYFKIDGVLAIIDRFLMIIVCGALLLLPRWSGSFKIEWFVWSQLVCYLVAVFIAFVVLVKITPAPIHFSFNPNRIKKVLVQSLPYALLVFLMAIYTRSDAVMIERLCIDAGKQQAGIYASAFRMLDMANIFGIMFAGMLLPMFAKMIAEKAEVNEVVRMSVNTMMPISFFGAIIALLFGSEIMQMLYHKVDNEEGGSILGILMCSFPAYCLMYIYSTLLTANGSITLLNKISFFIVVTNLSLHFLFIPQFRAIGAAYVALISEWLVAILVIIFAHRTVRLPHNYPWLLTHLSFIVCMLLLAVASKYLYIDLTWKLFGLSIIAFSLFFVFRFWTIQSFKDILQRKSND
ncbi:MAG: oligosaccharide flippase family protein [Phycisphaerales bacterium]|nr:oligosaccharide flippase family protein [Phycisphaerales bacterium]